MFPFTRLIRFSVLALGAAVCFPLIPDAEAQRHRIRLTTLAPRDSSFHKSLLRMGQEWKKETQGRVNLSVFAGGVQGGETAMIDRMRVNQTQAALISGVGLSEIDQAVSGLQQIPMMFRDYEETAYVMERMSPMLDERLREKGFVTLCWIDTGWVRIFSKSLLQTPDDMKQGRLFTWAGDNRQTDMLQRLGYRPVPIDSTEIPSALQTGLIDIVPMPPFFALAMQSYRPAPHMLEINYTPLVGALVISAQSWDAISEQDRAAMQRIAKETGAEMTQAGRAENEDAVRVMRERFGLKVREPDESILTSWRAAAEEAYGQIRDNTVPADIFDRVVGLLEEKRGDN